MVMKKLPRIASVKTLGNAGILLIEWDTGKTDPVYIGDYMSKYKIFSSLLEDKDLFQTADVAAFGTAIAWTADIDIAATTLWQLAREQAGEVLSAEKFRDWRKRQSLTLDAAAAALGISRRMVAYYDGGERSIPRVVSLATKALDTIR